MIERVITDEEIATAQRALRMRGMNDAQLQFVLRAHRNVKAFASRVIVAAAEAMLAEREALRK